MKGKILSVIASLNNKINKGHERSIKAKKNILASFIIRGCNIAISLVMVAAMVLVYVSSRRWGRFVSTTALRQMVGRSLALG